MNLPPFPEYPPPAPSSTHPHLVRIGRGNREQLRNLSLLLSAVGIEHRLELRSHSVLVATEDAASALQEWRSYEAENIGWPEVASPAPIRAQTPPTLLIMLALTIFFSITGPWRDESPWFQSGAIDSIAILSQGQWWRLFTALSLHADANHLLGNCLLGGVIIHQLCRLIGYGAAWFFLLLSAAAANWLNVALRQEAHYAVGLSTLVFAAIAMLSGLQLRFSWQRMLHQLLAPLGAGLGLLAFLGVEGRQVDLGAHFFGFLCGLSCGASIQGLLQTESEPRQRQHLLFILAALFFVYSWQRAWRG